MPRPEQFVLLNFLYPPLTLKKIKNIIVTPKASFGTRLLNKLRGIIPSVFGGIVQLANFPTLRYGNWSFTINLLAFSPIVDKNCPT
jgi:hypothetical protein